MDTDPITKILNLIHDPLFDEFERTLDASSLFNIVGRTHTETWHSALLGWLLNPASNHGIGNFALKRFIICMINQNLPRYTDLSEILITGDFYKVKSYPNETDTKERTFGHEKDKTGNDDKGRIDVLVEELKFSGYEEVRILIEMKVNAEIKELQCAKYINHIEKKLKEEKKFTYPVFVTPEWNLSNNVMSFLKKQEWIVISFQNLYNDVIAPCMKHSLLSSLGHVVLSEYEKTLKHHQGGKPMAITENQSDLAKSLISEHQSAIDLLLQILYPEKTDNTKPMLQNQIGQKKLLTVLIKGRQISGESVTKFYENVLKFLVEGGFLKNAELPIATGSKRYILSNTPHHQRGDEFRSVAHYKNYYMETNKSRLTALYDLENMLRKLGLEMTRIDS